MRPSNYQSTFYTLGLLLGTDLVQGVIFHVKVGCVNIVAQKISYPVCSDIDSYKLGKGAVQIRGNMAQIQGCFDLGGVGNWITGAASETAAQIPYKCSLDAKWHPLRKKIYLHNNNCLYGDIYDQEDKILWGDDEDDAPADGQTGNQKRDLSKRQGEDGGGTAQQKKRLHDLDPLKAEGKTPEGHVIGSPQCRTKTKDTMVPNPYRLRKGPVKPTLVN